MKVKKLKIKNIGGIKELILNFNSNLNVICGANGIGKTTILNVIADAFISTYQSNLKRNALAEIGEYEIILNIEGNDIFNKFSISNFNPVTSSIDYIKDRDKFKPYAKNILFFGIDRNIEYTELKSINRDEKREEYEIRNVTMNGVKITDAKNWFINRYMFLGKKGSLTMEQEENFEFSQKVFGILDEHIKFETVRSDSFDIILSTSKGNIYFEYLSSGYKSCIYIILGIIKEIEYRYLKSPIKINEFNGIILIDEIDLHLHPIWQAKLLETLRRIFPKVQFILTTHSPSLLQILEKDEIIALGISEENNILKKELNLGKYGLKGWTVEEILKDVMDMPTTSSKLYLETLNKFDEAMNLENKEDILKYYNLLKEMLHPNNTLQKLLSIQVAEWE